jgi:CheY-like chemotaxis protein
MPRLLLAEDDRDLRELLCAVLESEGCSVVAVANGREAIDQLRVGNRFDAAIFDVRMPVMTGLDALREARRLGVVVPILLVTSFGDQELHERAIALGAARVMDKPLAPEELREAVRELTRAAI